MEITYEIFPGAVIAFVLSTTDTWALEYNYCKTDVLNRLPYLIIIRVACLKFTIHTYGYETSLSVYMSQVAQVFHVYGYDQHESNDYVLQIQGQAKGFLHLLLFCRGGDSDIRTKFHDYAYALY